MAGYPPQAPDPPRSIMALSIVTVVLLGVMVLLLLIILVVLLNIEGRLF